MRKTILAAVCAALVSVLAPQGVRAAETPDPVAETLKAFLVPEAAAPGGAELLVLAPPAANNCPNGQCPLPKSGIGLPWSVGPKVSEGGPAVTAKGSGGCSAGCTGVTAGAGGAGRRSGPGIFGGPGLFPRLRGR